MGPTRRSSSRSGGPTSECRNAEDATHIRPPPASRVVTRYVAFLRGINLGNRRVKMADLRREVGDLELANVGTFIASGNVVFDHEEPEAPDLSRLERRMEEHLEDRLGFFTDTMIRRLTDVGTLTELEMVRNAEEEGLNVYATFTKGPLTEEIRKALTALETPDDRFGFLEREVLWLRRGGVSDSTVETRHLEKAFGGMPNTRRRVTTLRRMIDKFGS